MWSGNGEKGIDILWFLSQNEEDMKRNTYVHLNWIKDDFFDSSDYVQLSSINSVDNIYTFEFKLKEIDKNKL